MARGNWVTIKNKLNYKNKHKNILIVAVRCCIVICVFLLACCVCYLTIIVPDPSEVVCNRKCHNLEWPMICRYKFIIESQTLLDETIFTINRSIPGPSIIVCVNDIIVIDVENRIPELSITLHWHGQRQHETPFMDGVPMVTQCPISSFTTFQYKFRASQVGTHFYYAYSGRMRNYGTIGKFIVHEPNDTLNKLYDISTSAHIVLISELSNRLVVDAINFFVIPRMRYRFRIIYGSGENGYPIKLEIKNHTLRVIAIDGHRINPFDSDVINLNLGDRIDFILYADKIENDGEFAVKITSTKLNQTWQGLLIYNKQRNISTEQLTRLNIVNETNYDGRLEMVNKTIYIPIIRHTVAINHQTDYKLAAGLESEGILGIGNLTFTFPSKPYYLTTNINNKLLRQQWPNECSDHFNDESCENIAFGSLCDCVHVQKLDTGDYVEIIFVNFDESNSYTYHLHGYSFFIVGVNKISINAATLDQIRSQNENNNLLERNFRCPPQKDTVTIESKSIVAIRFMADNPGYWMLRELKSNSWTRGIDLILKVGDNVRIIKPPNTFPRCGDWIGPKFFFV